MLIEPTTVLAKNNQRPLSHFKTENLFTIMTTTEISNPVASTYLLSSLGLDFTDLF